MFEIGEPIEPECVLACRFQAKALNTEKAIAVNLGVCEQRLGATATRSWAQGVSQAENLRPFEVRAHYKKSSTPTKIQVIVEFESSGILEIKNIELSKAPVKVQL